MFATMAILIVLGFVVAALLAVALGGRSRAAVRLYCPVNETVVEVDGDRCVACEDGRLVGSIWGCERECLIQREASIAGGLERSGSR
jgi:hypothetical protein